MDSKEYVINFIGMQRFDTGTQKFQWRGRNSVKSAVLCSPHCARAGHQKREQVLETKFLAAESDRLRASSSLPISPIIYH